MRRYVAAVAVLLLAGCGGAPATLTAADKIQARRPVEEAERFHAETQEAIDRAEAAVREAERVIAAQASTTSTARANPPRVSRSRPAPRPASPSGAGAPASNVWDRLAQCESGGRWNINSGNGYFGGLQMDMSFWRSYGGGVAARPDLASREQQIAAATRARDGGRGYGPWPHCARKLGLR